MNDYPLTTSSAPGDRVAESSVPFDIDLALASELLGEIVNQEVQEFKAHQGIAPNDQSEGHTAGGGGNPRRRLSIRQTTRRNSMVNPPTAKMQTGNHEDEEEEDEEEGQRNFHEANEETRKLTGTTHADKKRRGKDAINYGLSVQNDTKKADMIPEAAMHSRHHAKAFRLKAANVLQDFGIPGDFDKRCRHRADKEVKLIAARDKFMAENPYAVMQMQQMELDDEDLLAMALENQERLGRVQEQLAKKATLEDVVRERMRAQRYAAKAATNGLSVEEQTKRRHVKNQLLAAKRAAVASGAAGDFSAAQQVALDGLISSSDDDNQEDARGLICDENEGETGQRQNAVGDGEGSDTRSNREVMSGSTGSLSHVLNNTNSSFSGTATTASSPWIRDDARISLQRKPTVKEPGHSRRLREAYVELNATLQGRTVGSSYQQELPQQNSTMKSSLKSASSRYTEPSSLQGYADDGEEIIHMMSPIPTQQGASTIVDMSSDGIVELLPAESTPLGGGITSRGGPAGGQRVTKLRSSTPPASAVRKQLHHSNQQRSSTPRQSYRTQQPRTPTPSKHYGGGLGASPQIVNSIERHQATTRGCYTTKKAVNRGPQAQARTPLFDDKGSPPPRSPHGGPTQVGKKSTTSGHNVKRIVGDVAIREDGTALYLTPVEKRQLAEHEKNRHRYDALCYADGVRVEHLKGAEEAAAHHQPQHTVNNSSIVSNGGLGNSKSSTLVASGSASIGAATPQQPLPRWERMHLPFKTNEHWKDPASTFQQHDGPSMLENETSSSRSQRKSWRTSEAHRRGVHFTSPDSSEQETAQVALPTTHSKLVQNAAKQVGPRNKSQSELVEAQTFKVTYNPSLVR